MSWMSILANKNANTPKMAKYNNLTNTLNSKMSTKGGPVFAFSLPGGGSLP